MLLKLEEWFLILSTLKMMVFVRSTTLKRSVSISPAQGPCREIPVSIAMP